MTRSKRSASQRSSAAIHIAFHGDLAPFAHPANGDGEELVVAVHHQDALHRETKTSHCFASLPTVSLECEVRRCRPVSNLIYRHPAQSHVNVLLSITFARGRG